MMVRLLPWVLCVCLLLLLYARLPAAWTALRRAHPVALASIVLFFAWNQMATIAWRKLLRASGVHAPLGKLVRLRIEAQAVNQLVPTAGVGGEALRTVSAAGKGELGAASLATVLDNAAGTASGLVFAAGAFGLYLQTGPASLNPRALLVAVAVVTVLLFAALALPFHLAPRLLPHLGPTSRMFSFVEPFAKNRLEIGRAFRDAVGLRLGERVLAAVEVYLLFHAVGAPVSPSLAALLSAVFVMVSLTAFFLPGQLGAAEAAVVSAGAAIGLSPAIALSAALLRRGRQLAVCAMGVVSLLARRRGKTRALDITTEQAR
jgi:uncharacterized membrane protein YbhN (UPF0104 family)